MTKWTGQTHRPLSQRQLVEAFRFVRSLEQGRQHTTIRPDAYVNPPAGGPAERSVKA